MMQLTPQTILRFAVGALVAAVVLALVWYFSSIVAYILISAILAVVGRPLVNILSRQTIRGWVIPRWAAAVATLLIIWAVASTFFYLFIPLVFNKIYQLSTIDFVALLHSIEAPIERVQEYLSEMFALPEGTISLSDALSAAMRKVLDFGAINSLLSSVVNVIVSSVIAIFSISFITLFFLKDEGLFYSMFTTILPERHHASVIRALDSATALLSRYFTGILIENTILMLIISIILMIFGMSSSDAFFCGLTVGILNVIPYAGPLIGGTVALFVGVVTPIEGMSIGMTSITILCTVLFAQGVDNFVLQPMLYSSRVKAHPLEIFIVILMAGYIAGVVGMLLAIPSYTVLRVFGKEFFSQFRLVRKLTEKI